MAKARLRTNVTLRIRNLPEDTLTLLLELIEEEGAKYSVVDQFRTGEHRTGAPGIPSTQEQGRVSRVRNDTSYQSKVRKSLET